jgi:hypothetical protein
LAVFYTFLIFRISFLELYRGIDKSTDSGENIKGFLNVWSEWGGDTWYCGR